MLQVGPKTRVKGRDLALLVHAGLFCRVAAPRSLAARVHLTVPMKFLLVTLLQCLSHIMRTIAHEILTTSPLIFGLLTEDGTEGLPTSDKQDHPLEAKPTPGVRPQVI